MPYKDPATRRKKHAEYLRNRYHNDPEYRKAHLRRVRQVAKTRIAAIQEIIAQAKKDGCALCSEREHCCLSFHHLDPKQKEVGISQILRKQWSDVRIRKELAKCICLCENCHRKIHAGIFALPNTGL